MMLTGIELEDVVHRLKAAQDELRIAINEEEDSEACNDLRRIIGTLQEAVLTIQLST
jgi:hypothetical protein